MSLSSHDVLERGALAFIKFELLRIINYCLVLLFKSISFCKSMILILKIVFKIYL